MDKKSAGFDAKEWARAQKPLQSRVCLACQEPYRSVAEGLEKSLASIARKVEQLEQESTKETVKTIERDENGLIKKITETKQEPNDA